MLLALAAESAPRPFSSSTTGSTCGSLIVYRKSGSINLFQYGERTQGAAHFLLQVQEASAPQGVTVQEVQGAQVCPGSSSLRQEAGRIWWSNQTYLQEKA